MDPVMVMIADQQSSRRNADRVPAALTRLRGIQTVLPFERTAGDEVQALLDRPEAVVDAVVALSREGGWRIGLGIGGVETPLPDTTRAARGSAYLAARAAISAAKTSRVGLALRTVRTDAYGEEQTDNAEAALAMLRALLDRRTDEGWQIVDLHSEGLTGVEAAARLGITPSAVSQRLRRSGHDEAEAGRRLAARLLTAAMESRP